MTPFNTRTWLAPAAELAAIFAALLGLDYFLSGNWGFAGGPVHPGWLPVLLMAAQYGVLWGLAAAALGTVLDVGLRPGAPGFDTMPFEALEQAGPLGATWLLAAVIVGGARDRAARRIASAEAEAAALRQERDLLDGELGRLEATRMAMQRDLAKGRAG